MSLCMQEETFHHCCQHLLQLSQQLRDGWSWESAQVGLGNLCSLMLQKKNSSNVFTVFTMCLSEIIFLISMGYSKSIYVFY